MITEHDLNGPHIGDWVFCERCRKFHQVREPFNEKAVVGKMALKIAQQIDDEIVAQLTKESK